jgi:hypothetical protein
VGEIVAKMRFCFACHFNGLTQSRNKKPVVGVTVTIVVTPGCKNPTFFDVLGNSGSGRF